MIGVEPCDGNSLSHFVVHSLQQVTPTHLELYRIYTDLIMCYKIVFGIV